MITNVLWPKDSMSKAGAFFRVVHPNADIVFLAPKGEYYIYSHYFDNIPEVVYPKASVYWIDDGKVGYIAW